MADQIKVAPGELSHRTLNKAISNAASAKKSLDKLTQYNSSTCIGNARYTVNGITKALFSGSVSSDISEAIICLGNVKSQLEALAPLLDSGPEAIENIDRNARLSSKSWAQKVFGSFHGIGSGSVIVGGNIKSIIDQNNCQAGGQTGGKTEVPVIIDNVAVANRIEYNFNEETETIKKEISDRNSTFKGAEGVTFNRKWYPYGPETYVACVWLAQRKLYARGFIDHYYSAGLNAMQSLEKDEPLEDKSFIGAEKYIKQKLQEKNGAPLYIIFILKVIK